MLPNRYALGCKKYFYCNPVFSSPSSKFIDVTVPLQNLVENSSLQLPKDITKSGLPGFYDPCPARDKKLKVCLFRFIIICSFLFSEIDIVQM